MRGAGRIGRGAIKVAGWLDSDLPRRARVKLCSSRRPSHFSDDGGCLARVWGAYHVAGGIADYAQDASKGSSA